MPVTGAIVVQNYWKHWPCLFPQHGPGRKHERTLGMAPWQWEIVAAHPADFWKTISVARRNDVQRLDDLLGL